jgi:hypothetical protein
MKAVVVISVLLSVLMFHGRIHAQVYPCAGPGPGEIMVGEQPASNGVGAIALCQRVAEQESPAPQQPVYRGPPPGVFGALAADDATGMYSSVYGQYGTDAAGDYAVKDCQQHGGKACRVIVAFTGYASVVSDFEGKYFPGTDPYSGLDALHKAFDNCNKQSRRGGCTLLTPPVIYGAVPSPDFLSFIDVLPLLYGKDWAKKDHMSLADANRLGRDLDALSARVDPHSYWGAIASDGGGIQSSYNFLDQAAAESKAMEHCQGCKIVQVFKDSCAGIAWPKDQKPVLETAVDIAPAFAKAKALEQCSGKYGPCEAQVRCAGRQYAQSNPDAPAHPPMPEATR